VAPPAEALTRDHGAPPGRRGRLVFDDELPGFGIRVTEDGAKVFLFQYHVGGKVRRLRFGRYGELTPAAARKLAEEARGEVAAGRDPVADRAARRMAEQVDADEHARRKAADAFTFGKLVSCWEIDYLRTRSASYRKEATRALRSSLNDLLAIPAHAIDGAAAQRALELIKKPLLMSKPEAEGQKPGGKKPLALPVYRGETMALRVHTYGRAAYAWAIRNAPDRVTVNPFTAVPINMQVVQRDRVLSDVEIGEIWRAAGVLGWPWGPYIPLLLLTLQRKGEVSGMTWGELEQDLALWELPSSRRTGNDISCICRSQRGQS
jgi:hypothetical protein